MSTDTTTPRFSRRKIGRLLGWLATLAALFATVGFVASESRSTRCNKVDVRIVDGTGHRFIRPADVRAMLSGTDKQPVGKKLRDINIAMLEKMIGDNSYVAGAEVFSTIDGTLHIDVRQRRPVIRIINHDDEHFYIDEAGDFMPVTTRYAANVLVASGFIFNRSTERNIRHIPTGPGPHGTRKPLLAQLYELALYADADTFWNAQLEQVYVNAQQQIELVPRVGDHTVLLGSTEALDEKLEKLKLFYTEGMNRTGWEKYSRINLMYKDQVVCTR